MEGIECITPKKASSNFIFTEKYGVAANKEVSVYLEVNYISRAYYITNPKEPDSPHNFTFNNGSENNSFEHLALLKAIACAIGFAVLELKTK